MSDEAKKLLWLLVKEETAKLIQEQTKTIYQRVRARLGELSSGDDAALANEILGDTDANPELR